MWPFSRSKQKLLRSHYVGKVDIHLTATRVSDRKKFELTVPISYHMNDRDERSIAIGSDVQEHVNHIKNFTNEWQEAVLWEHGGPFPKNFKPESDVLGEMLSRMIDAKLLGKKGC